MSIDLNIGSRISHPTFGEGVVCAVRFGHYKVSFIKSGLTDIEKDDTFTIIEHIIESDLVSLDDIKAMMQEMFDKSGSNSEIVHIADKWRKGVFKMVPFDPSLQGKEMTIESFFHKIVMLRDRLRVMEQKINSHTGLDDTDN